jgi:hypothetical protein
MKSSANCCCSYLALTSVSPTEHAYTTRLLLDDMMFQVFGSAEDATIEQATHAGVAASKIQRQRKRPPVSMIGNATSRVGEIDLEQIVIGVARSVVGTHGSVAV